MVLDKLVLIKLNGNSCILLQHQIDLAVLVEPDVGPRAPVLLDRSADDDALPVLAPLTHLQVVVALQRVDQPRVLQGIAPWKQRLPQILRRLDVLKVAHEKLGRRDVPTHVLHLVGAVVAQHYYFIHFEETAGLRDLADQVGLELEALRVVDDGRGHDYRDGEAALLQGVDVFQGLVGVG